MGVSTTASGLHYSGMGDHPHFDSLAIWSRKWGWALILAQAAVWCLLTWQGGVQIITDSHDYLDFTYQNIYHTLSQNRTLGYPLLLDLVRLFSPGLAILPFVHLSFWVLGAVALWWGMQRFGLHWLVALITGSSLVYADIWGRYGWWVISDVPAAGLALAAMGFWLATLSSPRRWGWWAGMSACLAAAWLCRPVYAFMALWMPALTSWLAGRAGSALSQQARRRLAAGLAIALIVPVVAFAGLRLATVGHFGLVSFQGGHLIGLAAYSLRAEMVPALDQDLRPVARAILAKDYHREDFTDEAAVLFGDAWFHRHILPAWWRERATMHEVYVQHAAAQAVGIGDVVKSRGADMVGADRKLMRLSLAIMRQRPWAHAGFMWGSFLKATWDALRAYTLVRLLTDLLPVSLLLWLAVFLWPRTSRAPTRPPWPAWPSLKVMAVISLSYLWAGALPVIFLQVPRWRYISPLACLLPALMALLCVGLMREAVLKILDNHRSSPSSTGHDRLATP